MVLEPIVCRKCGTEDNYRVEIKAHNQVAYCKGCGLFIKNIPYTEPTFYFGRYKGSKVSDLDSKEDLQWLEWCLKTVNVTQRMRDAISEQIELIKTLP